MGHEFDPTQTGNPEVCPNFRNLDLQEKKSTVQSYQGKMSLRDSNLITRTGIEEVNLLKRKLPIKWKDEQ